MSKLLGTGFGLLASVTAVFRRGAVPFGSRVEVDDATGECRLAGLTDADAERLLDWLRARGYPHRAASFPGRRSFVVRWRSR